MYVMYLCHVYYRERSLNETPGNKKVPVNVLSVLKIRNPDSCANTVSQPIDRSFDGMVFFLRDGERDKQSRGEEMTV